MRKLTQLVLFTAALIATPAFAEMKVAVLNYQMALLESDAAKRLSLIHISRPSSCRRFPWSA